MVQGFCRTMRRLRGPPIHSRSSRSRRSFCRPAALLFFMRSALPMKNTICLPYLLYRPCTSVYHGPQTHIHPPPNIEPYMSLVIRRTLRSPLTIPFPLFFPWILIRRALNTSTASSLSSVDFELQYSLSLRSAEKSVSVIILINMISHA